MEKREPSYTEGTSFIAQWVKNLPEKQEIRIQFLGREDSFEKEMAIHSSILDWRIPWTEEPGSLRVARVGYNLVTKSPNHQSTTNYTVSGNVNCNSHYGKQYGVSSKPKNRVAI